MNRYMKRSAVLAGVSVAVLFATQAHAGPTAPCVSGAGQGSTECGTGSFAGGRNAVAVGNTAGAGADWGVAVGTVSNANAVGAVAVGAAAYANRADSNLFREFTEAPDELGGVAIGHFARTQGLGNVAVGAYSLVGEFANNTSYEGGTAIGAAAQVRANDGTALGLHALASGTNSVAIGANSVADGANTVSFGSAGAERRLSHVADGVSLSDAVTVRQLNGVADTANTALADAATARLEAAAAQNTADTALAEAGTARVEAAAAQNTADTAVQRNAATGQSTAAALGGGAQFDPLSGAISAPSYSIGGSVYNDVGSAFAAVDTRFENAFAMMDIDRREARRGVAAAMAMTQAPFPSAPGRTSYAANTAVYRGEVAISTTWSYRPVIDTPFALSAGVSYAGGKNTAGRIGIAGEF